jgi:beta-lactamase regulating signal transducer with metallopeptidase domain
MSDLLEFVVRPSLALAAGFVGAWSFRKQPAAFRHWLLAGAVGLAAVQPLMTRALPALFLPSLEWRTEAVVPPPAAAVETTVTFAGATAAVALPMAAPVDWIQVTFGIWLAGALLGLGLLLAGALWLTWLGSSGRAAGASWQRAELVIRRQLGIRRPVHIAITRHPALLVTWGAIHPVILLPADADDWAADRIELVLAHEMAHLVRRDWLTQCLAETARAINWFNPLFWIACARLRRESEYACDDVVLDLGIGGTSYASHLVDIARTFSVHGRTWLPAPSIARPSTLERRVRAMLNPQVDRRPQSCWRSRCRSRPPRRQAHRPARSPTPWDAHWRTPC